MQIIFSSLFKNYPQIVFGFSTKIGLNRSAPFCFNLSYTVGDNKEIVKMNRDAFFKELQLSSDQIAFQKQIHSDSITVVERPGVIDDSDAMITVHRNIGLAVSSADCTPIFIYDSENEIIAAVHSGWRGTQQKIVEKVFLKLIKEFSTKISNLSIYIGPSISQLNYEVGEEVADQFEPRFVLKKDNKLYLDVMGANLNMIEKFEVARNQIEISPLCSFEEKELLHSYRRDGIISGRSLGVIALKGD